MNKKTVINLIIALLLSYTPFVAAGDLFELSDQSQSNIINSYKLKGISLKCFGDLRPEENIGNRNDYICWAYTNAVFDGIPAKQIGFYFSQQKLTFIRIELPASSYELMANYLNSKFGNNIDLLSKKVDEQGNRILTWKTSNGVVSTSKALTPQRTIIVLWISSKTLVRDFFHKLINAD